MKKSIITSISVVISIFLLTGFTPIGTPLTQNEEGGANVNIKFSNQIYDSLLNKWHEKSEISSYDYFYKNFIELDPNVVLTSNIPDSVYAARLKAILSPINMSFNDVVKQYIILYSSKKKGDMGRMIGVSQYYMPMFEQELARENLPLELKYLPIVESALIPTAISRAGAGGLWQFMLPTGKSYGLHVNSYVDDRFDPTLSTRAAVLYLKDLYAIFNDWTLALAAYNSGPGRVAAAIKKAGPEAKTFWDIYPYLPPETRGYIPSFIAVNYTFAYYRFHDIDPKSPIIPMVTDKIEVNRLMHMEQISSTIGIPMETLRALNPQYKRDIIPATDRCYSLMLPSCEIGRYIDMEESIFSKDSLYLAEYMQPSTSPVGGAAKVKQLDLNPTITHTIKSGDTLGALAKKHRTTVASIMKINKLKSPNTLKVGQRIIIK